MVEQFDHALMKLSGLERHTQPADLVFPRLRGRLHGLVGAASALRSGGSAPTCACCASRPAHTFGSLAINYASIVPVQSWMGHADVNTTMRFLDDKSRADDARLLSHAFRANGDAAGSGGAAPRLRDSSCAPHEGT
jgi:integrase